MDLDDCYEKGMIKKCKTDEHLISSLIEISDIKKITIDEAKLNDVNISVYLPIAYDSLREILEAICISKGYKVLSHKCIGELFKKLIDLFEYDFFDRIRYIRNGINYYGTKVDFEQGKELIEKIFSYRNKMKEYLKNENI
jgi:uncharacterized protein (UPF0332 family)